jgi:AcrR family transcriptional regulator
MPPRGDQEFESRRQQIIEGALHVFARKGFEKATNKDIAEAAGIRSPGLIYYYFKNKADLFRQVIEERFPAVQFLLHAESMMDMPPSEVLPRFATSLLKTLTDPGNVALGKLMLGEALRRPMVAQMISSIGPARGLAFLAAYLEHQMEIGVLRRMDPWVAARCFLGPLVVYVLSREVFPQPDAQTLDAETMVAATVEVFLRGMEPGSTANEVGPQA